MEVEMQRSWTDRDQFFYARLAGFVFLLNYALNIFAVMIPPWIRGSGDFAEAAARILASEVLYRVAITSSAVGWVSVVVLAYALYVTLEPVNKRLAQLALFMRLGEAFVGAVTVMLCVAELHLRLYPVSQATRPFQNDQLQALVSVVVGSTASCFQVAMLFAAAGLILFFYLFYKSRYIPRPISALAIIGSILLLMVSLASLIFPRYADQLQYVWAPLGIAEVTTAFWLAIAGIRRPPATQP